MELGDKKTLSLTKDELVALIDERIRANRPQTIPSMQFGLATAEFGANVGEVVAVFPVDSVDSKGVSLISSIDTFTGENLKRLQIVRDALNSLVVDVMVSNAREATASINAFAVHPRIIAPFDGLMAIADFEGMLGGGNRQKSRNIDELGHLLTPINPGETMAAARLYLTIDNSIYNRNSIQVAATLSATLTMRDNGMYQSSERYITIKSHPVGLKLSTIYKIRESLKTSDDVVYWQKFILSKINSTEAMLFGNIEAVVAAEAERRINEDKA